MTEQSMLERMEKAIRDKVAEVYGTLQVNGGVELARAAMKEMRDPTREMADHASEMNGYSLDGCIEVWQDMIDNALGDDK